jgi:type VI secretion system protein VasG
LQLGRIGNRVRDNHRAAFHYDEAVVASISGRCKEVESGARNVDHILTGTLLPEISREFLARMAEGQPVSDVHVGVDGEGKFVYRIQ